jgi:hypothetical protein
MRRAGISIIALAMLSSLIIAYIHKSEVAYFIKAIDEEPRRAGQKLAAVAAKDFNCNLKNSEYLKLAQAIFAVEQLASGPLKRGSSNFLIFLFLRFGFSPPDFSLGPGQIKVSTLRKAQSENIKTVLKQAGARPWDIILDSCRSLDIAVMLLRDEMQIKADTSGLLPRSEVLRAAKLWNGQASTASAEGAIANARYRELVYQTFVSLRFSQISQNWN